MKKLNLLILKIYIVSLTIVYCNLIDTTFAKTIIVPTDYTTIQAAINSAGRGDTVYVLNGKYINNGSISYKSYISIIGQDNQSTIIDGNGTSGAFVGGDAMGVYIENFKITNCSYAVYYYYNAGIPDQTIVGIALKNNVMENITSECLFFYWNSYGTKAVIENNIFRNCGTAMYMGRADTSVIIRNNYIYGCNKGMTFDTYSYPLICNNIVTRSTTTGIYVSGGNATILNNTVAYNGGEGISITHNAMTIKNNIICFNEYGISDYYSGTVGDYNNVYGNTYNYGIPKGKHDISCDPLFNDTLSYHLSAGSPCIDAGDPSSDFSNEPEYNGGRINLGAYGNTIEATTSHPELEVPKTEVFFDTLMIAKTDTLDFWIRNTGVTRLNIDSIFLLSNDQFTINTDGTSYILSGDSLKINLIFKPNIPGSHESDMILLTNDENKAHTTIKLHGVCSSPVVPLILSITDIPNDQGGWAKVSFTRSKYDTDSLILGKVSSLELYSIEIDDGSGWMAAASQVAYGKSQYSSLVHTTKDSTKKDLGLMKFRVIAGMEEGNFVSDEKSGYSVDNLAPSVPKGLSAMLLSNSTVKLKWSPNPEKDFKYYTIYRSIGGIQFDYIAKIIDTVFIDENAQVDKIYYYRISATDYSENESGLSEEIRIAITNIEDNAKVPVEYNLSQNFPNPFNPTTTISFSNPRRSFISLTIYDILGKIVAILVSEELDAGIHSINWDARRMSSGLYICQMISDKFIGTKKLVLLK